ncbi:AAA family ATPase [Methanogenium sp. S4BF]|uniref:AAA family ATPase n=1 Tax=Methanogenium sp. S4BF TaxID=1789226 RepID=UPI002416F960|nr:AAA family ATPase [Methanogenium sp. S4BF]WFN34950.1 AAA family ATPase [Methanogenium sp. S4BF]
MKELFLFAGPNGSGKSTIMAPFLSDGSLDYLSPDYCLREDPEIKIMPAGLEKSIRAREETERRLEEMISAGKSFAWETVFSHESRLNILKYAKEEGYRIHLTYVTTKDADINVARVQSRFREGGHDVPEEKIRGRYGRSVAFLPEMIVIADEVLIFDNSSEKTDPKLLFQKIMQTDDDTEPEMIVWLVDDEDVVEWVVKYVVYPLDKMGIQVRCYR